MCFGHNLLQPSNTDKFQYFWKEAPINEHKKKQNDADMRKGTASQGRTLRVRRLHNFWSGTTQWKCWWAGIWIIRPVGFALNSLSGTRSFTRTGTRGGVKLICHVDTLVQCVACCCYVCPSKENFPEIPRRINSQGFSRTHTHGSHSLCIYKYSIYRFRYLI